MSEPTPADPRLLEQFDNPLTITEAEERFRTAGLPRHPKSIERYCRGGSLRCKKEHGPNGLQYLIDPASAEELIEFLKQAHHIRSTPPHAPAGSGVLSENHQANSVELGSRLLPPAPAGSDISVEENDTEQAGAGSGRLRYVQQLEKRLDEKDGEIGFLRSEVAVKNDQIKDLTERARETNHLIAGLQKMIPLLGRSPDPHNDAGARSDGAEQPQAPAVPERG
jgi:hypothetical protein